MAILEKDIENKFVKYAKKQGCLALKWNSPSTRFVPDRIIFCPSGIVFFIEFKTATGTVSPGQRRMIYRLQEFGFTVEICRSFEQARDLLDSILTPQEKNILDEF